MKPLATSTPRTIVFVGATSGLGRASALQLAAAGHRLILVGRDARRGASLVQQISSRTPASPATRPPAFLAGDVSTRAGIEAVVSRIRDETDAVDTLVNNAGVMVPRRTLTAEGMELNFAVHHLAPFTMTALLLPLLARGAGRVVNTNSEGHRAPLFGAGDVRLDFDDLQSNAATAPTSPTAAPSSRTCCSPSNSTAASRPSRRSRCIRAWSAPAWCAPCTAPDSGC
ncbi:SDR family NAD(P)-dependent oxidoreductase [Catenulispora yoronensis]